MKSFQSFVSEENKRPVRVTNNPSGKTITNLPGGNVPDEQKFSQLERLANQKTSKNVAAASDVGVEERTRAANTSARARETKPQQKIKLGDTTKGGPVKVMRLGDPGAPSKEAAKTLQRMTRTQDSDVLNQLQKQLRDADKSAVKSKPKSKPPTRRGSLSKKADEVINSIRRGTDTSARMSAAYDKRIDKILKTPDVKSSVKIPTVSTSSAPKQPTAPKPEFKTTPVRKGPKITSNYTTQKWQGPTKSPEKIKTPATTTTQSTLSAVKKAARQERSAIRRSVGKNLSRGVRTLGVVGAGLEAKGEYDRRKELGQSDTKALAGTAARTGGGWAVAKLGAAGGAKLGSVLGPKGAAVGGLVGGIAGYAGGAELGTAAFDNFKSFQSKANKAYQRLLLPKYRTKTEEFVPEEVEFTVEFTQRLKDFARPVTNNPVVKAVTSNPLVRTAGRVLNVADKAYLGLSRVGAIPGIIDPKSRPSQKAIRAITTFAPPGIAHVSSALTPTVDSSKSIKKNIDDPIMRTDKKIQKAVGQHPKPGSGKPPNYSRLYYDMQKQGMSLF